MNLSNIVYNTRMIIFSLWIVFGGIGWEGPSILFLLSLTILWTTFFLFSCLFCKIISLVTSMNTIWLLNIWIDLYSLEHFNWQQLNLHMQSYLDDSERKAWHCLIPIRIFSWETLSPPAFGGLLGEQGAFPPGTCLGFSAGASHVCFRACLCVCGLLSMPSLHARL